MSFCVLSVCGVCATTDAAPQLFYTCNYVAIHNASIRWARSTYQLFNSSPRLACANQKYIRRSARTPAGTNQLSSLPLWKSFQLSLSSIRISYHGGGTLLSCSIYRPKSLPCRKGLQHRAHTSVKYCRWCRVAIVSCCPNYHEPEPCTCCHFNGNYHR